MCHWFDSPGLKLCLADTALAKWVEKNCFDVVESLLDVLAAVLEGWGFLSLLTCNKIFCGRTTFGIVFFFNWFVCFVHVCFLVGFFSPNSILGTRLYPKKP